MKSYTVKKNYIGSAVSEILQYRQGYSYFYISGNCMTMGRCLIMIAKQRAVCAVITIYDLSILLVTHTNTWKLKHTFKN